MSRLPVTTQVDLSDSDTAERFVTALRWERFPQEAIPVALSEDLYLTEILMKTAMRAGKVTVSGEEGHGFIGGNKPGSSFQYDQSKGIINCYYNAASPEDKNGAAAKTLSEMKEASFLTELNKTASWAQDADKNNGLPYLTNVKIPEELPTSEITVKLALATYDKTSYEF